MYDKCMFLVLLGMSGSSFKETVPTFASQLSFNINLHIKYNMFWFNHLVTERAAWYFPLSISERIRYSTISRMVQSKINLNRLRRMKSETKNSRS